MKINKWISWKHIGSQLVYDLIGKDSFRGVSLTYSWLANQFGHLSIGFIHTMLLIHLCKCQFCEIIYCLGGDTYGRAFGAAVLVSLFWFAFETVNFLGPLLTQRRSNSNLLFVGGKKYQFNPRWWFVGFDTATDVCVFAFGAFLAAYVFHPSVPTKIAIGILMIILLLPCYYWFVNKMYQKCANYPMQFNLSQWDLDIDEKGKKSVHEFIQSMLNYRKNGGNTKHLLIFGSKRSGKSSLGIGIASGLSDRRFACRYLTANNLYSLFFGKDSAYPRDETIWDWKQSELLVIDEINPGRPVWKYIISPDRFLLIAKQFNKHPEINPQILCNKFVIWIVGNRKQNDLNIKRWKAMILEMGIKEDQQMTIDLSKN
ncbi:MAG: ATP-binding protein [Saprospiraceae bacterium]|nr:ATP-binding protein [Saprospiraceae bacterium]MBK8295700.1 ATP-binding protein [Saprospiraceae bacterium]